MRRPGKTTPPVPTLLPSRGPEREAVDRVLQAARGGRSAALVVLGRPGAGKTTLLEYAMGRSMDLRLARVVGIESEKPLRFAGLHQLLAPFLPRLHRVPVPQRDALGAAFGSVAGVAPDRFFVGLAVLTLLADASADQALLVVIDDAQWLDRASAEVLAFVARRLRVAGVAFLVAVRDSAQHPVFDGLLTLHLGGQPQRHARDLLAAMPRAALNEQTTEGIITQEVGKSLVLVGPSGESTEGGFAEQSLLPEPSPISHRLKQRFPHWVGELAVDTSTLPLAAAEPSSEVGEETVSADRQHIPAALAALTDPDFDTGRRAWQRVDATVGTNDYLVSELAQRAPAEHQEAQRLLMAAQAELTMGAPDQALATLEQVLPQPDDRLGRARALQLRGAIRFAQAQFADAPSVLLCAASEMHLVDLPLEREVLLEALRAGLVAGRFATGNGAQEIALAARSTTMIVQSPTTVTDLLLDGFATRLTKNYTAAVPLLRAAVTRLRVEDLSGDHTRWWMALGCVAARELLDDQAQDALARRWMQADRKQGALGTLPVALGFVAGADLLAGRFAAAEAHLLEAREIAVAKGLPGPGGEAGLGSLLVLAWRGRETAARAAIAECTRQCNQRGLGMGITVAQCALAVLELALGRYEAALACARNVYRDDPPDMGTQVLPDLVEAAARTRDRPTADAALNRLAERAHTAGTHLALGLLARSRALLADDEAEKLYREAIEHLQRSLATGHLARAHLLYGEWLRRQRRRRDARTQLRTAHEMFESMGAESFTQRAQIELRATGERVHHRATDTGNNLTAQETQISRLVAKGESNPQIAAQLFISPHTVEYHLGKVFRKLGVGSRTKLARVLLEQADDGYGHDTDPVTLPSAHAKLTIAALPSNEPRPHRQDSDQGRANQ